MFCEPGHDDKTEMSKQVLHEVLDLATPSGVSTGSHGTRQMSIIADPMIFPVRASGDLGSKDDMDKSMKSNLIYSLSSGAAKSSNEVSYLSHKTSIEIVDESEEARDAKAAQNFLNFFGSAEQNIKPHKSNDKRWEEVQNVRLKHGTLALNHFRLLKRLGCGDIGSVYLVQLKGSSHCYFAMKVMDKESLASRKKLLRAQTEREILKSLDHPFLPSLYAHFDTEKFSCLVMEFCSGGDLHVVRQRQPGKHFTEAATRFYAAEVLLSLEYLHMMGVVYRDLKPENVLVREDGHIMLSDFDLSLQCMVRPTLEKSTSMGTNPQKRQYVYCVEPDCLEPVCISRACTAPACALSSSFLPKLLSLKRKSKPKTELRNQVNPLPELIAEPTGARSLSLVGTHEYLAPEIIKGEGHGSAVDWWTFGIFLYELLYGKTPFKGAGNKATLFNVIGQPLMFPETSQASFAARDLIHGLLAKDPQHRIGNKRGAAEIKQHPFFEGVNWALVRSMAPPEVPQPFEIPVVSSDIRESEPKCAGTHRDFDLF